MHKVKVYSKALDTAIDIERIIGHIKGKHSGPTVIFIGGIHGNEPSGVFALHHVCSMLQSQEHTFKGSIYALAGNLSALEKGIRYHKEDLNRMWDEKRVEALISKSKPSINLDSNELSELYNCVSEILEKESGPFYFIDLHTTSSPTQPFITVNDNLLNRKFTVQYPVPILLGIEEYLEGTFLNYINEMGYVAFGFESGQHDALSAIENHTAFIYLSLVFGGSLPKALTEFEKHLRILKKSTENLSAFYEIVYHYSIATNESFSMLPGFKNFEMVQKGRQIALSNGKSVTMPYKGTMFMPLYQKQGTDGFFVIHRVPTLFLRLSTLLRKLHIDALLPFLPGISWASEKKDALTVNLKIARFFAKKFFHLLGYRSRKIDTTKMTIKNREAASLKADYRNSPWY